MQTVMNVDMASTVGDNLFSSRTTSAGSQDFGRVMNEARQAGKKSEVNTGEARSEQKAIQQKSHKQAERPETADQTDAVAQTDQVEAQQAGITDDAAVINKKPEKVQHELVNLLQTLAEVSDQVSDSQEVDLDGLLSQLVTTLNDAVDNSELHGEHVVAGVDLSPLVDMLKDLESSEDPQATLSGLTDQLKEQLHALFETRESGAAAVSPEVVAQAPGVVPVTETLAQARQLLQKAIDAVASQNENEVAGGDEQQVVGEDLSLFKTETKDEIDPRFAGLLNVRQQSRSGSDASTVPVNGQKNSEQVASGSAVTTEASPAEGLEAQVPAQSQAAVPSQPQVEAGPQQATAHNVTQSQGQAQLAGLNAQPQANGVQVSVQPQAQQVFTLASGTQVSESQIFDQVVTHISGSANGETGRMVVRLNPAELGSLKLDLQVEGDKVRANIHAQSQQVQEVIERNLPQLRNALAEQGLKIDQFQVSVDQQQDQNRFAGQQQQQSRNSSARQIWHNEGTAEEQSIPLAHLVQNGGGGISLHV